MSRHPTKNDEFRAVSLSEMLLYPPFGFLNMNDVAPINKSSPVPTQDSENLLRARVVKERRGDNRWSDF